MSEPLDDDSRGFAAVERAYVRQKFVPDFEWLSFDDPSSRTPLPVPLEMARVALIGTAGAHVSGETAMSPRGEVRFVPVDAPEIQLTHPGYDTSRASLDPEVVFPRETLRSLASEGLIAEVAPTTISTMGFIPQGQRILDELVPQVVQRLRDEDVHLALLVPA
jgi:hypothetical protein